jgi:hypothetical protein
MLAINATNIKKLFIRESIYMYHDSRKSMHVTTTCILKPIEFDGIRPGL